MVLESTFMMVVLVAECEDAAAAQTEAACFSTLSCFGRSIMARTVLIERCQNA